MLSTFVSLFILGLDLLPVLVIVHVTACVPLVICFLQMTRPVARGVAALLSDLLDGGYLVLGCAFQLSGLSLPRPCRKQLRSRRMAVP